MDSLRILIVEDDRDICTSTALAFRDTGYQVDIAYDLAEAKRHLLQARYDVALLDYKLPDGNGLDLFEQFIKRNNPDVLCVFLTAHATLDMIEAVLEAGAMRVLPKPIDLDEVVDAVEDLAARPV